MVFFWSLLVFAIRTTPVPPHVDVPPVDPAAVRRGQTGVPRPQDHGDGPVGAAGGRDGLNIDIWVDDGLNIDIWVTLYSLWNSTAADAFRRSAKGREAWACKDIDAIPLMVVLGGAGCWVLGGVWWPGPVRISTQCRSPGTHITNKQTNKHIFNTSLTAFQALAPLSPPSNKLYPP